MRNLVLNRFLYNCFISHLIIAVANVGQQQKEGALSTYNLDVSQDAVDHMF